MEKSLDAVEIQEGILSSLDFLVENLPNIMDPRVQVLIGAIKCVTKNRNKQYGEPEDNFRRIAGFQQAWFREKLKDGEKITNVDVAATACCIKMGRLLENPLLIDNPIDLCGYAACMYQVAMLEAEALLEGHKTLESETMEVNVTASNDPNLKLRGKEK